MMPKNENPRAPRKGRFFFARLFLLENCRYGCSSRFNTCAGKLASTRFRTDSLQQVFPFNGIQELCEPLLFHHSLHSVFLSDRIHLLCEPKLIHLVFLLDRIQRLFNRSSLMNSPSVLNVYIDQESDGMWLIDDYDEHATRLSHAAFIQGHWLYSLDNKQKAAVRLIIERAHGVDAQKSPAQRFTADQWAFFKQQCKEASDCRGVCIELHAWPERTTPSARTFLYGKADKADKDSGVHDIKAMRAYHHARMSSINLMNMMEPRHSTPQSIFDAVDRHKEVMNFNLLRLKNHKYPADHPWVEQCMKALPEIVKQLSPEQLELLELSFHKRNGTLNKSFNKSRVLTLWAATHNLDGSVLKDDSGRPVGRRFLKTLMGASPFRQRHCGIHRANIMRDFRKNFIERRIGKVDKEKLYQPEQHEEFVAARNSFNREWLKLAQVFKQYEVV